DRVLGAVVGDVEAHRPAHQRPQRLLRRLVARLVLAQQLATHRPQLIPMFGGVLHSVVSSAFGCSLSVAASPLRWRSSSLAFRIASSTASSFFRPSSRWNFRNGATRIDSTLVSRVRITPAECLSAFSAACWCPSLPMMVT